MKLSGWGCYPRIDAQGRFFGSAEEAAVLVTDEHPWIAHGAGRSYGDSALEQRVIFTRRFDRLIDFDDQQGIIHCSSGMLLGDIVDLVLSRGWFLRVTPGTKHITLGGAIAADVHGKNHHQAGCFSNSVLSVRLMMPDGQVLTCSRKENSDLFRATCGGMGLTGLIMDAVLQLEPVNSAFITETTISCKHLDEVIETLHLSHETTYSVAWIDCLAGGQKKGRGLVMLGEHADDGDLSRSCPRSQVVPAGFPSVLLNRYSVSLFNQCYYRAAGRSRSTRVTLDRFFYPLDRLEAWNRMYGPAGFIQYQFVIPEAARTGGLRKIMDKITKARYEAFLGVLKLFGPENENMLSFPMHGVTLALDFKVSPGLFSFLDELDRIVLDHGGRHYLAKDARIKSHVFGEGYPKLAEFRQIREQYGLKDKINSLQSKRLGI